MQSAPPANVTSPAGTNSHAALLLGAIAAAVATGLHSPEQILDPRAVAAAALIGLWAGVFAAWFLSRVFAAGMLAALAAAYAAVLLASSATLEMAAGVWVVVCVAVLSTSFLLSAIRRQLERLTRERDEAVRTDGLTGLLNRKGLTERFDLEIARSRRSGRPLSVLLGDVDQLASINEQFGRAAGDAVLEHTGRVIAEQIRNVDAAARYGGEEFAILLPDTPREGALIVAGRLRSAISSRGAGPAATISFGVACYPADGAGTGALLHTSEEALRSAKAAGGNRSAVPTTEPLELPEPSNSPDNDGEIDELFLRA